MYRLLLVGLLILAVPSACLADAVGSPEGKDQDKKEAKQAPKNDGTKGASIFETDDGKRAQLVYLVNGPPIVGVIVVAVLVLALLGLVMFQVMMLRSDMERLLKK